MRTITLAFLLLCGVARGQDSTRVNLHLAGIHYQKAAWFQETSAWWLLFGSAFTFAASRPKNIDDGENIVIGLGTLTIAGACTFTILSSKHQKKAAMLLL